MKLPRLTIREKALVSANIALGLALAIDRHRAGGLAVAVELGDREIHLAEQTIDQPRMELAECGENLERADAELTRTPLAAVRRWIWAEGVFAHAPGGRPIQKLPPIREILYAARAPAAKRAAKLPKSS